jgi:hypothetical protein
MIIYEIYSFADFFYFWYRFCFLEFWYHKLEISASPWPSSELLILGPDGPIESLLIDEIHLTDCRSIHYTKHSPPSEITPPVLKSVFYDRCERPIVRLLQTEKGLSVDGEIAIKFWILTLKKLPHSRTSTNKSSEESSAVPIVRIYRSILIYCSISLVGREEDRRYDREESLFNFCICIYSRDESICRIEWL